MSEGLSYFIRNAAHSLNYLNYDGRKDNLACAGNYIQFTWFSNAKLSTSIGILLEILVRKWKHVELGTGGFGSIF